MAPRSAGGNHRFESTALKSFNKSTHRALVASVCTLSDAILRLLRLCLIFLVPYITLALRACRIKAFEAVALFTRECVFRYIAACQPKALLPRGGRHCSSSGHEMTRALL